MPWEHQKELQKKPIPTVGEMLAIIQAIPNDRDRALFALLYLTAGRVTEVLGLKRNNIVTDVVDNRKILMIRDVPNRKNKNRKFKSIPIPIDREREFVVFIQNHVNRTPEEMLLFNITKQRAGQITRKYGFNPHFLRHIRLTHLVTRYDFNELFLVKFAGWTDSRPAKHYMELRWKDFLQKM